MTDDAFDTVFDTVNFSKLILLRNGSPINTSFKLSPETFGLCYLRYTIPALYRDMYLYYGFMPYQRTIQQTIHQFLEVSLALKPHLADEVKLYMETPAFDIKIKDFDTLHLQLYSSELRDSSAASLDIQLSALTINQILAFQLPTTLRIGAMQAQDEFVIHSFTMRICHCTKVILSGVHFERHIRRGCPSFPLLTTRRDFGASEPLVLDTTVTPNLHRQLDEVPHVPARIERDLPINFSYDQYPPHRLPAPYVPVDITDWHLDFVAIVQSELPGHPPNFKPRDYPPGSVVYVDWFRGVVAIPVELSTYPDLSRPTAAYSIT